MKRQGAARLVPLVLAVGLGACAKEVADENGPDYADASFGQTPAREVVADAEPGLGAMPVPGPPGMMPPPGPTPAPLPTVDGGPTPPRPVDAAIVVRDAAPLPVDRTPDVAEDVTPDVKPAAAADVASGGPCSPLAQDCRGAGQACYPVAGGGVCRAAGLSPDKAGCASDEMCAPTLTCFDGQCRKLCDSTNAMSCPRGEKCVKLGGQINVGACY
jgi:hypothetical protein